MRGSKKREELEPARKRLAWAARSVALDLSILVQCDRTIGSNERLARVVF